MHDRREASPLTSVAGATVPVPGVAGSRAPTVYARVAGNRIQYWLFYADNPHDRGIVRTGRHEGDWELVQVTLRAGRPSSVLASQHAGAERCAWSAVRRRGGHPVVFVAHGSHAGYFRPGTRDRTWPDPNDEAPGDGRAVRPRVERVTASSPEWMRWPGRWGRSRAGWVPGESDSPRGPAFQGIRWDDPAAFEASARACGAARAVANRAEDAMTVAGVVALLAAGGTVAVRRRRRRPG